MKKVFWLCALLAVLIILAGCGTTTTETVTVTQTVMTPAASGISTQAAVSAPPTAAPAPASFKGTGTTATAKFHLEEGLYRVTLQHDGEHNFIVRLLDSKGKQIGSSLANETGPVNQTKALRIDKAGDYLLDIQADGNWNIVLQAD